MGAEQTCKVIVVKAYRSQISDLQLKWQNVL